jgi:hypothetical protein
LLTFHIHWRMKRSLPGVPFFVVIVRGGSESAVNHQFCIWKASDHYAAGSPGVVLLWSVCGRSVWPGYRQPGRKMVVVGSHRASMRYCRHFSENMGLISGGAWVVLFWCSVTIGWLVCGRSVHCRTLRCGRPGRFCRRLRNRKVLQLAVTKVGIR